MINGTKKKQNSFEVCKTHSAIQQFGYKRDFFAFAVTNQNEILGFGDGKVSALLSHSSCKQETVFKLLHNLQNPGQAQAHVNLAYIEDLT